ncbi:MAG: hypothetical protein JXR86_07990 [Spirochaetales bacterium]|nr:hypothetical protein [Spirochaetales bacterium]
MERLKEITSEGKIIIFLNLRDYKDDKIFFREILHHTSELLKKKGSPQLFLADFTGIPYTHKYFEITREFISGNLDYIRAAALTGVHLEQEIDPDIIMKAADLHILFFNDINDARNWLSQK